MKLIVYNKHKYIHYKSSYFLLSEYNHYNMNHKTYVIMIIFILKKDYSMNIDIFYLSQLEELSDNKTENLVHKST